MYNRVILMGRLTADPELKQTQSGLYFSRFSVAVDRGYAKQGEERKTDFFDVVCWKQTAEFVNRYFSKGRMIHLEGRLQNNNYTDQNGVKHYRVEIQVDNVGFCGDKQQGGDTGAQQGAGGVYNAPAANHAQNPAAAYGGAQAAQNANQRPVQQSMMQQNSAFAGASMEDFEDVLSDGETPF